MRAASYSAARASWRRLSLDVFEQETYAPTGAYSVLPRTTTAGHNHWSFSSPLLSSISSSASVLPSALFSPTSSSPTPCFPLHHASLYSILSFYYLRLCNFFSSTPSSSYLSSSPYHPLLSSLPRFTLSDRPPYRITFLHKPNPPMTQQSAQPSPAIRNTASPPLSSQPSPSAARFQQTQVNVRASSGPNQSISHAVLGA